MVDDDERLPLHWAVSHGHIDIVTLLAQQKDFDPDAQVSVFTCFRAQLKLQHCTSLMYED